MGKKKSGIDPAGGERPVKPAPEESEVRADKLNADLFMGSPGGPGVWAAGLYWSEKAAAGQEARDKQAARDVDLPDPENTPDYDLGLRGGGGAVMPDYSGAEAAIGGMRNYLTTTRKGKQVTSPTVSKERYGAEEGRAASAHKRRWEIAHQRKQSLTRSRHAADKMGTQLRGWQKVAAEGAAKLKPQWQALDDQAAVLKEKFDKAQIDPGRYLRQMPAFAKALTILGAGLSRDLEGVKLIQHAVDRDIAAQRAQIHKTMQSYNMTVEQSRNMWQRWSQLEGQKKDIAKDLFDLSQQKQKFNREASDYDMRVVQAKRADERFLAEYHKGTVPKVVTTTGSETSPNAQKQAMKARLAMEIAKSAAKAMGSGTGGVDVSKLDAPALKARMEAVETATGVIGQMRSISDYAKNLSKLGGSRYSKWAKTQLARITKGLAYNGALTNLAEANMIMAPIIKMYFGGHASDQDREFIVPAMLQAVDSKESQIQKLNMWHKKGILRINKRINKALAGGAFTKENADRLKANAIKALNQNHKYVIELVDKGF